MRRFRDREHAQKARWQDIWINPALVERLLREVLED